MTSIDAQLNQLLRGVADIKTVSDLQTKLALGRPLRVKLGIDPTASNIHLGFAVVLRKLRAFQDLGHQAVLIVGDHTAQVGDPSERNATRPILTEAQVKANAESYLEQIGQIVDLDRLEVRYNGEWFSDMRLLDVIRLASRLTVARMIERDDFDKRLKAGQPVGLHELLYPMMQGYDSVMVEADVELGGRDQLFNLLVGRQLQPLFEQPPQVCMMMPLLVGTDGVRKMSKSYGNTIGIRETAEEQYGKSMSIPDALMRDWFTLCTDLSAADLDVLLAGHPREAKHRLAHEIARIYHGPEAAEAAREHFHKTVVNKEVPDDIAQFAIGADLLEADGGVWIVALVAAAFGKSRGDARRLVRQGAVQLGGEPVTDENLRCKPEAGALLKAGKRAWVQIAG